MERQRGRDTGGAVDTAPEVQAAGQVEEEIYTTADSLRVHTADAVSKSISRHKRKQQKNRQRTEQATGGVSSPGTEPPPPPVRERMRENAASEIKTRPEPDSPPAPLRERRPGAAHERPTPSSPGLERIPAGPSPKERMRQAAIKEKRDRTGIRQRPATVQGTQQADLPVRGTAAQPGPQERMRQKARAELQAPRAKAGRVSSPPRPEAPLSPAHSAGSTPAPLDRKSATSIKERPRRSFAPKEKPAGGAFIPKTRQAAAKSGAKAVSAAARGKQAAQPFHLAKRRVQRNAQRTLLKQSQKGAKAMLDLSRKAAAVTVKAVSSLISAIAGLVGGAFLVPVICLIILVGAIIASPFGILFSNEPTPGAMPLNVVVGQLNMELSNTLETMQAGDYDGIDILTPDRVDLLKAVFWDMCAVTSEVETVDHPDSDPDDDTDDSWTERILHITVTAKTAEDMRTEYAFTERQNQALTELLDELAAMDLLLADLSVSQEQARNVLRDLPADLSPERRAAVETACRLVGKVNYFWGGKSYVIGWDSRWGTIQKVWSAGSSTTGTYRPFGLDCSGFIDWALRNAGLHSDGHWYIGRNLTAVSQTDALPGDIALYPDASHVGMVVGRNEAGKLLVCHCSSGQNNVVITEFAASGFTVVGRLAFMDG